jgi:heptosyltransferase-2
MTTLVIQTSFLGDMVLTTPLIAHLAASGPVDVLATPAAAALLANSPHVREAIMYDKRGADRGARGFVRLARALRGRKYTGAYLAQGSVRSGALAAVSGIRDRIGFSTSAGRRFYTVRVPYIENTHHAARLLSLATRDPARDVPRAALRPHLYPGPSERTAVDDVLGPRGAGRPIIALAPGSVWATKRWPYYADLARALSDSAHIAIVGAAADRALAEQIVGATNGRAVDATGRLTLLASAELIGRAALLVTNDSAPLHLASAMNTPTIAVFGPTVPEFGFGPLADASTVVGRDSLTCRPCDRHGPQKCPLGHWRCMREISPEDVAELARSLMTRGSG